MLAILVTDVQSWAWLNATRTVVLYWFICCLGTLLLTSSSLFDGLTVVQFTAQAVSNCIELQNFVRHGSPRRWEPGWLFADSWDRCSVIYHEFLKWSGWCGPCKCSLTVMAPVWWVMQIGWIILGLYGVLDTYKRFPVIPSSAVICLYVIWYIRI